MKKDLNKKAQESEWLSADGWESADSWEDADAWESAEGAPAAPRAAQRVSAPYIIQIVNSCTSAISSVDVGDSYLNRSASNFNANSNITITCTVSGVSYIEFLAQSESQPFSIGRTLVISTTAGQLNQTVAVTHRDASGNRSDHVITPIVDPYQVQTDRIIDDYEYLFDGYTRLRFNQILGSATVTVYLYPITKFAATQLVAGRPAQQNFRAPHLIKVAPTPVARPRLVSK